jgi:hypothetical protein
MIPITSFTKQGPICMQHNNMLLKLTQRSTYTRDNTYTSSCLTEFVTGYISILFSVDKMVSVPNSF